MVKKRRVHRLTDYVVTAERERDVAQPARKLRALAALFDDPRSLNEVDGVAIVLLHARRHREDIGIEDDVLRRKPDLFGQQLKSALANPHLLFDLDRLTPFVERHHHNRRAITTHKARTLKKLV